MAASECASPSLRDPSSDVRAGAGEGVADARAPEAPALQPVWERYIEGLLALDINALCNYGYSLWRDKKNAEGAQRILQRVLDADPTEPVPNISLALPGERWTREQLVEHGLEIDDLDAFITRNMTEIFARPAVQQALHKLLDRNSSAAKGDDGAGDDVDYLRKLVEDGVPPGQWLKREDVHYIYEGLHDMPDSIAHPDGPDGRVAYAKALCALGEIALNFYNQASRAESYFQRALLFDPQNALAKCWWAVSIWRSGGAMGPSDVVAMPGGVEWRRGDFVDKAEELLMDAANLLPSHSTVAAYACAFMIEERGEYGVAQDYLQTIMALDPTDPDLYHAYALLQLHGGAAAAVELEASEGTRAAQELCRTCQSEAVKAWKQALSLHPAHNPSVGAYASRLMQQEQFSAAEAVFRSALRVHPSSAVLTFKLAQMKHMLLDRLSSLGGKGVGAGGASGGGGGGSSMLAGAGETSGAGSSGGSASGESEAIAVAQLYDTTLALDPAHTNAMLAKAHLLHNSVGASARDVEELYQRVLRRDPLNVEALCNYGLLLHETPPDDNNLTYADYFDLDESLRQARQLAESDAHAQPATRLPAAIGLVPEGRVDEGEAAMPAWAAAAAEGGGGLASMRQAAAASALFEGALRINGHHVPTLCNYANFLASQYQHDIPSVRRARQLLTHALRLDPHHLDCLSSLAVLVAFYPDCLTSADAGAASEDTPPAGKGAGAGEEEPSPPRSAAHARQQRDFGSVEAEVKEEEDLLQRLLLQRTGKSPAGTYSQMCCLQCLCLVHVLGH